MLGQTGMHAGGSTNLDLKLLHQVKEFSLTATITQSLYRIKKFSCVEHQRLHGIPTNVPTENLHKALFMDVDPPTLKHQSKTILLFHDENIFSANEDQKCNVGRKETKRLSHQNASYLSNGRGKRMTSDSFYTKHDVRSEENFSQATYTTKA